MSKPLQDVTKESLVNDLVNGMNQHDAAEKYGISKRTVRKYLHTIRENTGLELRNSSGRKPNISLEKEINENSIKELKENLSTFAEIFNKMDDEVSNNRKTEDLIDMLKTESQRKFAADDSKKNVNVKINIDGPIGVSFFGDPHIDNEGCDWEALCNDIEIVKKTEGMFAGNIGDQTDNWVGRLSKFYQHQKISRSEALQLVEWMFKEIPWLFIVMGNHDHWNSDTGNVLDYIFKIANVPGYKVEHDARFHLNFPNGNVATIRARHNFSGKSAMNPVHGMVKETQLNLKDDILVCGDWHHSGYQPIWYNEGGKGFNVDSPILCHAIRVGTYKKSDNYAIECGFKEENWSANMVAIIDPYAQLPRDKVKVEFSPEAGADRLNWMRSKYKGKNKKTYDMKKK